MPLFKIIKVTDFINQAYLVLVNLLLYLIVALFTIIPWAFIYLEIGRYSGPWLASALTSLVFTLMSICTTIFSFKSIRKIKKNTMKWTIFTNLIITLIIIFLLFLLFTQQALETHQKIDTFITQHQNMEFHQYVSEVCSFLNNNVKNAYKKPEACFKIYESIYSPISLGKYVTQQLGFTRADIIVYQGWGTCGQAAILIEELLAKAGYETRRPTSRT